MLDRDRARLDGLYDDFLQIEKDIILHAAQIKEQSKNGRRRIKEENKRVQALRESRREELLQSASSLFQWVKDLASRPKGRKILSALGEVAIFRRNYLHCRPVDKKECQAVLLCDRNGIISYREFYMGLAVLSSKVFTSPEQMVARLHPDYVLSVSKAIATGEVWEEFQSNINWQKKFLSRISPDSTVNRNSALHP